MRISFHTVGWLFLAALPFGVACSNDGPTSDRTPPLVMSITPQNFGIARNTTVVVVFSEPIAPATVTMSTFNVATGAAVLVPGTFAVSGTTATFTPSSLLAFRTQYFIQVRDVEDIAGNAMEGVFLSSFETVWN